MKLSAIALFFIAATVLLTPPSSAEPAKTETAARTEWKGYPRLDFKVDGRTAWLVEPKTPLPAKPWIWRTEFFGHEPQGDLALLEKGFYVAYIDVQNMYGAPVALGHMDRFYDHVTKTYGLASKTTLEGFSRGGLFAFNWAAKNPEKVASIYVDAPVCDFKSWPGGKGTGKGSKGDWAKLLTAYGFKDDEEALKYDGNPIDNLKPLADAKIPVLAVCGDADDLVPLAENMKIIEERYKKLGGEVVMIVKPGVGHHPHSLVDPAPIVDFVVKNAPTK